MESATVRWVERLGYADAPDRLHTQATAPTHPYAPEIRALLDPRGEVRATAVFEVDGVPAVCFIEGDPAAAESVALAAVRNRVWNQGLLSAVIVVGEAAARVMPALPDGRGVAVHWASPDTELAPYTAHGVESAALLAAHGDWFSPKLRIDEHLIDNLQVAVERLTRPLGTRNEAQLLMAQVLFVSYLEHRGIVHDAFRKARKVGSLPALVEARDGAGIDRLIDQLSDQFNGDFLRPEKRKPWTRLSENGYATVAGFLAHTDLRSGQTDLWGYDFRFIPVELLSGIYESFIGDEAGALGAFYTPRHLANLAVDEALDGLDPSVEPVIYDGACGSGILLTTAFRRLLARAESAAGRPMTLGERGALLKRTIFGGDVSEAACIVTAFSLYLALLEDLVPSDIAKLTRRPEEKLPSLVGNLFAGAAGDMFRIDHPVLTGAMPRPTILLSNPPWREPKKTETHSYEQWLEEERLNVPLRQIAIAFARRATRLAAPGARLCLIMPAPAFLKPQSQAFLSDWLDEVTLRRLINLSDLRMLVFRAKHACVVAVATASSPHGDALQPPVVFEYLTPKADVSLAYRRLSLHVSDRKLITQQRVQTDPAALRTLYWGSEFETGQLTRLRGRGELRDLITEGRFVSGKGFHVTDGTKRASTEWIAQQPFLDARQHPRKGPALGRRRLDRFTLPKIASQGDRRLYEGWRVLFTDGMTPQRRIRAVLSDITFTFNNSIACIRDLENDGPLMAFLATYLSSDLAAYFALLLAPTAVLERTQIKLAEVESLPFWLPERHPKPKRAHAIIKKVVEWYNAAAVRANDPSPLQPQSASDSALPPQIEALVREYFLIDTVHDLVVEQTARIVLGSVQPTTVSNFPTALQRAPTAALHDTYRDVLVSELARYRDALRGEGALTGTVIPVGTGDSGFAVVVLTAGPDAGAEQWAAGLAPLLERLVEVGALRFTRGGVQVQGDLFARMGNALLFAKPMITRLWLASAAFDDALRITRFVQASAVGAQLHAGGTA